ncbi:TniQ family protein [Streptomyces aureocirculatus]|uniref:TniQ family protein n=1 Tax=Streptomyces aureocirculatus TaxID=67275 RepID=UPI00068F4C6B|nr:TniQ family protein [Streptomyces aureocirculatus]
MAETANEPARPLGMSLEPLAGESLNGYLLRLAYRLHLEPNRLTRLLGCGSTPETRVSRRLHLDLRTNAFARATRLTEAEGEYLTLRPWADRYPPISRSLTAVKAFDSWLFNDSPRYCPQCLAGDGSTVQQEYGGCWKKVWQMPIASLCPDHLSFLHHGCPRNHEIRRVTPLFAGAKHAGLHPAECRLPDPGIKHEPGFTRTPCRVRLDRRSSSGPGPNPVITEMQARLLDLLDPDTSAEEAAQRFADLRVVTALLCASWPMGQDLLTPALATAVAGHVHEANRSGSLYSPPRSPVATAALLFAAEAVLGTDDLEGALAGHHRASWSGLPSLAPWSHILNRHRSLCSERLLLAAEPSIRAFRRDGGAFGLRAPTRTVGYQPEHIAAALEHGQFERHLAVFGWGTHTRAARRLAAVKLVQWRIGGAMAEATSYLGVTHAGKHTITRALSRQIASHPPDRFTTALRALARELDAAPNPVDYRRRRVALNNWSLSPHEWQDLRFQRRGCPAGASHRASPGSGSRRPPVTRPRSLPGPAPG